MVALVSFLAVVALELVTERTATVALTLTGLSRDAARFQARSAFSGTGFTTGEAEGVVGHPVRRRIIMLLMTLRSFGVVTGVSSLILSFVDTGSTREGLTRAGWLVAGLVALTALALSPWVDRHLSALIAWALRRWTDLDARDYLALLRLAGGYTVRELQIHPESWLAGNPLSELDLPDEGVVVLGIQRADGGFVGAPRSHSVIHPHDTVILYGQAEQLAQLEGRRAGSSGDRAHGDAVLAQQELLREQDRQERTLEEGRRAARERRVGAADAAGLNGGGMTDAIGEAGERAGPRRRDGVNTWARGRARRG